jgi:cobalamin biosynthetic protein CobC
MMAGRDWAADAEAFTYHGGALDVARRLAPGAPEPWVDLSTGVNPHPYPLPDLTPELWSRLPGSGALAELEAAAAVRYGAAAGMVVAGPGSQALIQALARIIPRGAVGVLGPTYGGLKAAFAAAGAQVDEAKRVEDMGDLDVAIVVNPNNPDGRIMPRADLLELHRRLARRGGVLIVDEAFADFDGASESLAPVLPAGTVVLRSFG